MGKHAGGEPATPSAGPGAPAGVLVSSPRRRRRRWLRRTVAGVVALVVLVVAGTVAYNFYLNSEIHRVALKHLTNKAGVGAETNTTNVLLVGSTSRCALKVQNPAYGLCDQGVTGVNSDVVMILHLNPNKHTASILSIPRDLFVPNARTTGANKIDAALYQGPDQLVNVIQEDFGISIQHYVELNFDTFAGVVDALGGVRMYFPMPVFDAYSGLNVPTPGCRLLNGFQALQVVRARHLQYKGPGVTTSDPHYWPQEVQSDLARIRRDHEFLRVLAKQVKAQGLGNPITDERLAAAVAPQLQVDSGLSATALASLILTFHSVNPYAAPQMTIPVSVTSFGSYHYKGYDYGDIEFPSEPQDRNVVEQFLGVGNNVDTLTGATLPAPSSVSVSVVNGSGVNGQAAATSASLAALGFHTLGVGTATPVAAQSETLVAYASLAQEAAAERVERSLTGNVILDHDPSLVTDGAQVTVVTGSDFQVTSPASATTPSASGSPAATTPSSTPAGSLPATTPSATPSLPPGVAPPSPAVEALQPWDPRSCTPSGGEGP